MGQHSPYTPQEIKHPTSGPRGSMGRLLEMVDTSDPAFTCIVSVLKDMQSAGIELTAETVSMAVALGRQKRDRSRAHGYIPATAPVPNGSIVYYIRRGEAIKIGTTTTPARRFQALMPTEILAFEPGGVDEEFARHMQFVDLRLGIRGEHFRAEPELMEHIADMRNQHGTPDPTWPSLMRLAEHVDVLSAELPPPTNLDLATVAEGARLLGLNMHTVYGWVRRGKLQEVGINDQKRSLYYVEHMTLLNELHRRWRGGAGKIAG